MLIFAHTVVMVDDFPVLRLIPPDADRLLSAVCKVI